MDARALRDAMGRDLPTSRYPTLVADMNAAMVAAACTTEARAAMWCAQLGHESMGLRYFEEIASGAAYNGRRDLGNTQPGDGPRFKGRGPIQLTGRHNYTRFRDWCRARGIDAPDFVASPGQVATSRWGFLAASWYWVVERPRLNSLSDARNLEGATRAINGGLNGIDDRRDRYRRCVRLGAAILPLGTPTPVDGSLRLGVRDDPATERWQGWLKANFGAYAGDLTVDGDYGPATQRATAEFQKRSEITGPDADGTVVGPRTLAAARRLGFPG